MDMTPTQIFRPAARKVKWKHSLQNTMTYMQTHRYRSTVLLLFTILLLLGSAVVYFYQSDAFAAPDGSGCSWYRVRSGDTLSSIAWRTHTTVGALAQANRIRNVNLIGAGRALCIPHTSVSRGQTTCPSASTGVQASGTVCWYAYSNLQTSTRGQVAALLRQVAARYGLPANLLLAIAWQESGWNQHVISPDGGIGVMQVMPYTAAGLNTMARTHLNPYRLLDNIELGAIYLHTLWTNFHGNLSQVISAYNEGGWNVLHRGIFNWSYVNNVLALMRRY